MQKELLGQFCGPSRGTVQAWPMELGFVQTEGLFTSSPLLWSSLHEVHVSFFYRRCGLSFQMQNEIIVQAGFQFTLNTRGRCCRRAQAPLRGQNPPPFLSLPDINPKEAERHPPPDILTPVCTLPLERRDARFSLEDHLVLPCPV